MSDRASDSRLGQFAGGGRYTVIPRTLVFLRHGEDVLLLKGAPTKRLWANRYNGLGGHVEAGETIEAAARREVAEEAGITAIEDFRLVALINVEGDPTGVLLCVFTGSVPSREVVASREGTPEWVPLPALDTLDLVDGPGMVRAILATDRVLFGHQRVGLSGEVEAFTLE
jgi:8-oxo-dGTP diphosphatase